jgi:hypothetical protein
MNTPELVSSSAEDSATSRLENDLSPVMVKSDDLQAYYCALGEFIHLFSQMETHAHLLLAHAAGIDLRVANAVFGAVRIAGVEAAMKRLAEVRKTPISANLAEAFKRLRYINDARNAIVHYGAHYRSGTWRFVSNSIKAISADRTKVWVMSPDMLDSMTNDVRKIDAILLLEMSEDDQREEIEALYNPELSSKWRY